MDHYKTLGLGRNATKEEIKEAFRRSALKFHPDRHTQSSSEVREGASLRFRQASEAYEVLIDDRKRADYDIRWRSWGYDRSSSRSSYSSSYYGGRGGYGYGSNPPPPPPPPPPRNADLGFDMSYFFRVIRTRGFLINLAFASALLGGAFFIEGSMEAIWKVKNSGKSFEEAMDSIEKVRMQKEDK